jgi:pSer/pThr/pTyr-binding forkhead associated (FHA) protein
MAICSGGHDPARTDVCEVCGLPAGRDPAPSSFPYSQATWSAVIDADRAYYDRVQEITGTLGAAVPFPGQGAARRFQLRGNQMRIGRRSASRGLAPEIDLSGPPADPGISRLHAVLVAVPAGHWAVLDPGSANGTLVNGAEIATGQQVMLREGDCINLGAWTAITVYRDDHLNDYRAGR